MGVEEDDARLRVAIAADLADSAEDDEVLLEAEMPADLVDEVDCDCSGN